MASSSLTLHDPPTPDALASARRHLDESRASVTSLTTRIQSAEARLAQIVRESQAAIKELQNERAALESQVARTLAYLSPIRRLPMELLRMVFLGCFEDCPCSAWVLAAVCSSWRRLALRIPVIWSKIRLFTTQHASADIIRLWLERSGNSIPLDIEISLRVAPTTSASEAGTMAGRPRRSLPSPLHAINNASNSPWTITFPPVNNPSTYPISHPHPPPHVPNVTIVMPLSPTTHHDSLPNSHERPLNTVSRSSMHWGHVAFFYLGEHMHRWERFVFRFDKQFFSIGALKSIIGDAPFLKEFEVSSTEAAFFAEWPWLPNMDATNGVRPALPNLRTLTLHHTPFKWSSPVLRNLHTLNLRALPTLHLPVDRILFILSNNPELRSVSLHFQGVLSQVLPLTPLTLQHVTSFSVGGHPLLTQLIDNLILPNITSLTLDIEARDPIEDVVSSLLARSNSPTIEHLSLGYGTTPNVANFYYGPGNIIITWSSLLNKLSQLKSLAVGGSTVEALLTALGPPEDDPHAVAGTTIHSTASNLGNAQNNGINGSTGLTWACPLLTTLQMRNCQTHGEGIQRLVQMIDARNPAHGGPTTMTLSGVAPVRLKKLEMKECDSIGEDVVRWLQRRVKDVSCDHGVGGTFA